MKKNYFKKMLLSVALLGITVASAQNISFLDANFKSALLSHQPSIDINGDSEVSQTEAANFTGTLNVNNKSISDLDGIQYFTNITDLECNNNQLTDLDVSANTQLTKLGCHDNQLASLDISTNIQLTKLDCHSNELTGLDISANTQLIDLGCDNNQLMSLDVSVNTQLIDLECNNNQLTDLDVSTNTQLTDLDCNSNQLASLDVSTNTQLIFLDCYNNQLTDLDVSANTQLTFLYCDHNQLTCIKVNQNQYDNTANDWIKNAAAEWNTDCSTLSTEDVTKDTAITMYPNPTSDFVTISWSNTTSVKEIEMYSFTGKKVLHQAVSGNKAAINVGHLPTGIYIVKIGDTYQKLIIE